ncbi:MAG: terminase [Pseudomonadota bacterium]
MEAIREQTEFARWVEAHDGDELARMLFKYVDVKAKPVSIYEVLEDGRLGYRFHKYQKQAMAALERFILLLAGTQSGKTSFGPIWLFREVQLRGCGDYLAVAPTYPLMKKKMLPEFLRYFQETLNLGEYNKADKIFTFSEAGEVFTFGESQDTKTVIHFGHAQDPDSLESATAKGAWLDECGQKKFKLASYEAIMRRLSLFMGRVLMTTTPYYLGWLKSKFWDKWQVGKGKAESIRVIRFPSNANPSFPQEEYERAQRELPQWKFDMFYNAIFTRPAGMIYDCFNELVHKVASFTIPENWRRYVGMDFGGVNTAAVYVAQDPKSEAFYVYKEYLEGSKTAEDHATAIKDGGSHHLTAYGGAPSEDQWRREMTKGGLSVQRPPIKDVEVGIDRVYGLIKTEKLYVMDNCEGLLDEFMSYSREINESGEATEKIENKNDYHRLDALRYICSVLKAGAGIQVGKNPYAGHRG